MHAMFGGYRDSLIGPQSQKAMERIMQYDCMVLYMFLKLPIAERSSYVIRSRGDVDRI